MRHVALLMEFPTLNGGERSTLAFCDQLLAQGFRFTAIAPEKPPLREAFISRGIPICPIRFHDSIGHRIPLPELRTNLRTILREINPDVLHAISLSTSRIAGPVDVNQKLVRVGHLRDIMRLSRRAVDDINQLDAIFAVSKAVVDYHTSGGIDPRKTRLLYNGVDTQRFTPRPPIGVLHQRLNLPPAAQIIGAVGQIALRKGLDTLIDAFHSLAHKYPDSHLVIIGERYSQKEESIRYEQYLHAQVDEFGLKSRIHFPGYIADMHDIYPELYCLVHCAHQEPLGRVLLEAAASGTPVVATRVGGTLEVFPDANHAWIVEPGNVRQIESSIVQALSRPDDLNQHTHNSRRRIIERFDIRLRSKTLMDEYLRVTHEPISDH